MTDTATAAPAAKGPTADALSLGKFTLPEELSRSDAAEKDTKLAKAAKEVDPVDGPADEFADDLAGVDDTPKQKFKVNGEVVELDEKQVREAVQKHLATGKELDRAKAEYAKVKDAVKAAEVREQRVRTWVNGAIKHAASGADGFGDFIDDLAKIEGAEHIKDNMLEYCLEWAKEKDMSPDDKAKRARERDVRRKMMKIERHEREQAALQARQKQQHSDAQLYATVPKVLEAHGLPASEDMVERLLMDAAFLIDNGVDNPLAVAGQRLRARAEKAGWLNAKQPVPPKRRATPETVRGGGKSGFSRDKPRSSQNIEQRLRSLF